MHKIRFLPTSVRGLSPHPGAAVPEDFREQHSLASCKDKEQENQGSSHSGEFRAIPNLSKGHFGHERRLSAQPAPKNFSSSSRISSICGFFKKLKSAGKPKDVEQK